MATPEEHEQAAKEALAQARALIGEGDMSFREFLESMARSDTLIGGDPETCGMSCHQVIDAQVARDMLAEGEIIDAMSKWSAESQRRWRETKFFKLWQEETAAGRDPLKAFEERGWEA